MSQLDRRKLHFGPYAAPRFRYGNRVECGLRGEVVIVGLSAARIPWPLGRVAANSNRSPIVYAALAKALRKESNAAVCYWWGVTPQTVTRWRKAIGVNKLTEGDKRLISANSKRNFPKVRKRLHAKAHDPVRAAKIAAARRGKPRPAHVMEPARQANIGRKPSRTARAKMSAAQQARGARPPWLNPAWSAEDDALLKTLPAAEAANRTGRTLGAVYARRSQLQLPDGRRRKE